MKSSHCLNITLLAVGFGTLLTLLALAGCAPMDSPYLFAYEYEEAQRQKQASASVATIKSLCTQGKYDDAISSANSLIKKYPSTQNVRFWRGRAYYEKQMYQEAMADLNYHVEHQPNDNFGYNTRGNIHDNMGNIDQAIADYDKAIQLRPNSFYHYKRALFHQKKGNLDKAVADLTTSLNYTEAPDMVRFYGAKWKGDVLWRRGATNKENGNLGAARADALQAMEYNPKRKLYFNDSNLLDYLDLEKRQTIADHALADAKEAETQGNYITAFQKLQQAHAAGINTSETDNAAIAGMQRLYAKLSAKPRLAEEVRRFAVQAEAATGDKNYDQAVSLYDQALSIAPWWPQGHFNKAMLMAEKKNYQGAIAQMKQYIQLVPDAQDARLAQDKIYEWEYKLKPSK